MKFIYLSTVMVVLAAAQAEETYTTENDDLDIEAVVSNVETFQSFIGCFMDTVTCDPVAADFKKDLPEAVAQSCVKCTTAQKHIFKRFLEELKKRFPQEYEEFKKKYDPEGIYFDKLEKSVAPF